MSTAAQSANDKITIEPVLPTGARCQTVSELGRQCVMALGHQGLHAAVYQSGKDVTMDDKQVSKTRCKVYCSGTQESMISDGKGGYTEGQTATFQAVYDSNPDSENAKFFSSTPQLSLTVAVARGRPFETLKYYFLDFTETTAA